MDVFRKKKTPNPPEWTKTGTLMSKPERGWIHADQQLNPDAGICYGVRYIGCLEVKQSMKLLEFDQRTAIAKECINRICDAAGLKTYNKKKRDKKAAKMLAEFPNMQYAGSNITLTITTESINLMIMESGEIIANHQMTGISFASGGDSETTDFVAYVAKDSVNHRACHVLECGGGLAQDVITTIGQAFELRYKEFLLNKPRAVNLPDRLEQPFFGGSAKWEDEPDYYNQVHGAQAGPPPVPPLPGEYSAPQCNLPVSDGVYSSIKNKQLNGAVAGATAEPTIYDNKEGLLVDLSEVSDGNLYDEPNNRGAVGGVEPPVSIYDNPEHALSDLASRFDDVIYDNKNNAEKEQDAFDMKPVSTSVSTESHNSPAPAIPPLPTSQHDSMTQPMPTSGNENLDYPTSPDSEEWFHGKISRKEVDQLLKNDGDFLVRESSSSVGQYILSGRKNGHVKHLLLVDPEGVVRTKDRTFACVSHLVDFHMTNNVPIISQESELFLLNPVSPSC